MIGSAPGRGSRLCRRITREYARTFYFASHCLPWRPRQDAYAVYGFCRWADNCVDEAVDLDDAVARVERSREMLDLAYSRREAPAGLEAFRRTVRRRGIPRDLFDALLDGMTMDLTIDRYATFADLDLYCYRVAGVVGLMMTHVFGYRDERCFPHALSLGTAMQLTNILRDVGEDLDRGRIYLPQDELAEAGVTEEQLRAREVDERFRAMMRTQIDRARAYYADAELGVGDLIGWTSRLTVRVMGDLYGGILNEIEGIDYQVLTRRASVPTSRKLAKLLACVGKTCQDQGRPTSLPRRSPGADRRSGSKILVEGVAR